MEVCSSSFGAATMLLEAVTSIGVEASLMRAMALNHG
jgi:hypothetical protein